MAIAPSSITRPDPRIGRLTRNLTKHHSKWVKAQPLKGGKPAGWRTLTEQVVELAPDLRGTSYETIRKLHLGMLEWGNVRAPIIAALAAVYGVPLSKLSPDLVRQSTSDLGSPLFAWVTADSSELASAAA